jgi:exosortase
MSAPAALPRLPIIGWITVALAAVLTAAFSIHMWPAWLSNPDLSHGLFTPFLFLFLLNESRRRGPARYLAATTRLCVVRTVSLIAGLGLVVLAGLYAAAIDWSHPLASLSLAFALASLLFAALLWLSSQAVRALPFNWITVVAAGLWPLCSPLPPGTYSRLTLQLQFWVTDIVLGSLHLLGIPAATVGNVIQLAHTSVGVEEACSGVRSLVSCVVAAVFFSAALLRRPWTRALLIALAPLLAFAMNIVRSLTLTLLANSGIDINGHWHDLTGFAVLGITALCLGGLAVFLEGSPPSSSTISPAASSSAPCPWDLLSAYTLASAMIVFFVFNTHGPARPSGPAPDLGALLPESPSGWDLVHTENLYRFTSVLETDTLIQRSYLRRQSATEGGRPLIVTVYVAYWAPGQAPVSLVASHTPEACWPGTGWVSVPAAPPPSPFIAGGEPVSTPEYRAFTHSGNRQNVWYWHLYDGRSIAQADPRSATALLKLAWNYGFRTEGEQLFVRVSSNRPWADIQDEPLLTEILARLKPRGL